MPPPLATSEAATPPVDLAVGKSEPLPPKLQAQLHPIQRFMRSPFGLLVFMFIGMFSVTLPVIGIPPLIFFLEYLGVIPHHVCQRFFDLCTGNWITIMTHLFENFFGIKIRTFGFDGRFKRRSLIIMNHVSHFDWIYLWDVIDRQGDLSYWKAITKSAPFRHTPILGHCMQLSCFFFISRKWERDRLEFQKKLHYFNAIDYPVQLLLFPEGGDLTPKTRSISDKYADENNLPRYRYCFHPRTTGFNYIMNVLREGGMDAVYDISVGYPDVLPKVEVDAWNGIYPKEVHFHIRSYEDKDIPKDEDGMKTWLEERWQEKEAQLKDFYTHLEFKDPPVGTDNSLQNGHVPNGSLQNGYVPNGTKHALQRSPEVTKPHNITFLLYSIFIIVSTNIILIVPWLYIPYFSFYMFCSFVWMMYRGYWDYSQYIMSFKEKEVEETLRKSKYKINN